MINIGILDFLMSGAHQVSVLNCSSNYEYTTDLFELILTGKYCDVDTYLGVLYLKKTSNSNYLIIDGKRRLLSIMLLLKAVADYHYNLSPEVSVLSSQINSRYLKYLSDTKLQLFGLEKTVYEKIINNEPLSYNEKQTEIFMTFDSFRDSVKQLDFDIQDFYDLFNKLRINIVFVEDYNDRDIFYSINKDSRDLNQLMLFKSYLAEAYHSELVDNLHFLFGYKEEIFVSFFKAYLSPKFSRLIIDNNLIYDYFVKYIETIKKYQNFDEIIAGMMKTAKIYKKMYNAEFADPEIRNMFIKIISNNGRDTFSYLLELCEDFDNKYLSKETLLEIGKIINTYIQERKNKSSQIAENLDFSKMVQELNKVIYDENSVKEFGT